MKLTRDKQSGAILNLDEEGYRQARMRKELAKKKLRTEHEQQSLQIQVAELAKRVEKLERMMQVKRKTTEIETNE